MDSFRAERSSSGGAPGKDAPPAQWSRPLPAKRKLLFCENFHLSTICHNQNRNLYLYMCAHIFTILIMSATKKAEVVNIDCCQTALSRADTLKKDLTNV